MDIPIPITLEGSNLKFRHIYFNSLVNQTFDKHVPFQDIVATPEKSVIDRLFKIDMASKYKNVEYILQNLKDDEMLFISRSLKCLWLFETEYCDIINPLYLENQLYPEMIQPAVKKMKHWIQLHLKDPERCQEFYNYYKKNFQEAFNYLCHCSNDFILNELPNTIYKLTAKQLKIIFEICPTACKLYFDILPNDHAALSNYVQSSRKYFATIKSILKYDGDVFLDIFEKYFDRNSFKTLGANATKYIMNNHRNRFDTKSELYVYSFLDMKTVAANLTADQAKDLVIRIAQAKYLEHWFSYERVEPLIKRLKPDDRADLKKQVFVNKFYAYIIEEWPYPLPKPLILQQKAHVFTDVGQKHEYYYLTDLLSCRRAKAYRCSAKNMNQHFQVSRKSPLDQLFNRYRFKGFEETFFELSKNLSAESTKEGRLNMMLVLVSKSGGVAKYIEKLLNLLVERHRNEPSTLRAAVIRSLVKRECAWRLPDNVWSLLLEFGRDIGLDGADADPMCREGLHAVVIRHLLADTKLSPTLLERFIREFSTLSEYKLNAEETKLIAKRLPPLVLPLNSHAFLDTILKYKVNIKNIVDAGPTLLKAAKEDAELVERLYDANMFRRELINETFALNTDNASYVNALRHDPAILKNGKKFASLVTEECPNHDRFLQSLSVYFSEPGGLAEQHRISLEEAFASQPRIWFGRPLCFLLSNDRFLSCLSELESERPQSKGQMLMSVGLKANAHRTKPPFNIDSVNWQWIGAKAVANRVLISRAKDREIYIERLMEWTPTAKIAVRLSESQNSFIAFCSLRPFSAIKLALSLYLNKDYVEPPVWNAIKSVMENKDISKKIYLLQKLSNPSRIPNNILSEYWAQVFKANTKIDGPNVVLVLCRLENLLPELDQNFITGVIKDFLDTKLNPNNLSNKNCDDIEKDQTAAVKSEGDRVYVRIIAKLLLLSKSETAQKELIETISDPFFDAIDMLNTSKFKNRVTDLLYDFIFSLKYSKVFLSRQYVSCLPVYDHILKRLRKILPVEENFTKYAEIHLTMLYYKTLQRAIELQPDILNNSENWHQATEIVGRIFGNYIGHEMEHLVAKYFKSIVDLFKISLNTFLCKYFNYNEARINFVSYILKGLLEVNSTEAFILAEYIFQKEHCNVPEPHRDEILKTLMDSKDKEVRMFLYADVICAA